MFKKIGVKISAVLALCILLAVGLTVTVMFNGNVGIFRQMQVAIAEQAMNAFENTLQDYQTKTEKAALMLGENYAFITDVRAGNWTMAMSTAQSGLAANGFEATNVIYADLQGNVLASLQDGAPASIADLPSFSNAAQSGLSTGYERGDALALSIAAAAPVMLAERPLGVVLVTYSLEEGGILSDLKALLGSEYGLYAQDQCLYSTIRLEQDRSLAGTALDARAASALARGEQYAGNIDAGAQEYSAVFRPLLKANNEVAGAIFAGRPLAETARQMVNNTTAAIAIVGVLMVIIVAGLLMIINRMVSKPIVTMAAVAKQLSVGQLDVQVSHRTKDELGVLASALNTTAQTLKGYIGDIATRLEQMAQGDMTAQSQQQYIGDFAPIGTSLDTITASLCQTLSAIQVAAQEVHTGADQVASGAQSMAQGAAEQASAIEQLSASIGEVTDKVERNAQSVNKATENVDRVRTSMDESSAHMGEMLTSMDEIESSSNQIQKIIKVIDDIAFQTNILALNAAVEAARAGNAGRGFAVVAGEVRNLAAKSAEAASTTTLLIEQSAGSVGKGKQVARKTAHAMDVVREAAQNVDALIHEIEQSSQEQAQAIAQINKGIEQISVVVQNNSATTEQSAAASTELSQQAATLQSQVSRFRLDSCVDQPAQAALPALVAQEDAVEDYGKY